MKRTAYAFRRSVAACVFTLHLHEGDFSCRMSQCYGFNMAASYSMNFKMAASNYMYFKMAASASDVFVFVSETVVRPADTLD